MQGKTEDQGTAMKWTICIKNSGESYLYPAEMFAPIAIQNSLEGQLLAA
jgi:hypothetical protein